MVPYEVVVPYSKPRVVVPETLVYPFKVAAESETLLAAAVDTVGASSGGYAPTIATDKTKLSIAKVATPFSISSALLFQL